MGDGERGGVRSLYITSTPIVFIVLMHMGLGTGFLLLTAWLRTLLGIVGFVPTLTLTMGLAVGLLPMGLLAWLSLFVLSFLPTAWLFFGFVSGRGRRWR